jgi:sugar/nucleoside kinase (ribokinase family)
MFDVITIGSAVYDSFIEVGLPQIDDKDTIFGKSLKLPLGEKFSGKKISFEIGGNAVNAAITFSRQSFRTGICVRLGGDVFGEEIQKRLSQEKIKLDFVETDKKLQTSSSTIFLSSGERTIINFSGAGNDLSLQKLWKDKPKAKWFYLSLPGESYRLLPKIISFAKKQNAKIALNPTAYHIKRAKETILDNLRNIDFLVLNETEASMLTNIDFKEKNKAFRKLDKEAPGILAVTYGKSGAVVSDGKFFYRAGIFKNKKIVDRTGAGDAFGSGLVAGLMRGGLKEAIELGLANSASVVEEIGANKGVLTRNEFKNNKRWFNASIKIEKI